MRHLLLITVLSMRFVCADVAAQHAEVDRPDTPPSLDARLTHVVYAIDAPVFTGAMKGVHVASVPLFLSLPPVAWGGALLTGGDLQGPTALSASWLGTYGMVTLLKNVIQRPRPFFVLDGIERRGAGPTDVIDRFSFPSGHASLAFTIATSLSLSYPAWYVVAPSYLWASATALSRVWHGVHYPSDIVVGALLGSGIAVASHYLIASLFEGDGEEPTAFRQPPLIGFVLPIR